MKFNILASGSKGNSTLIVTKQTKLLIDCGLSISQFSKVIAETGINDIQEIDYVLVTHNHVDHTKSLNLFSKRKIYSGNRGYSVNTANKLEEYATAKLGDLKITPITLSHDTVCYGYIIENEDKKLVYITDTGYISRKNEMLIKNADYYIIESNHDIEMLMNSDRTMYLKQRILSDYGHLSNRDCGLILAKVIGSKTKAIYLAHISEEANTEQMALACVNDILKQKEICLDNILIKVAKQWEIVSCPNDD